MSDDEIRFISDWDQDKEDHRTYVGGDWKRIGNWQFKFLVHTAGLNPNHTLLDIACGSLRLGVHAIPYLEPMRYFGLEGEVEILQKGIEEELGNDLSKDPQFAVNKNFNFDFCGGYDIAWANSLFSHLSIKDITQCFTNLRKISSPESVFWFTFFPEIAGKLEEKNPLESHARKDFRYKYETLLNVALETGWQFERINASHPRKQAIVRAKIRQ